MKWIKKAINIAFFLWSICAIVGATLYCVSIVINCIIHGAADNTADEWFVFAALTPLLYRVWRGLHGWRIPPFEPKRGEQF